MVEFFFFAITQIFSEGIITCHRCRCCFCPRGSCSRAQRAGGAFVEVAHLISAINWQLCRSQETLGLRLKAVHLLLRGRRVAAGRRSSTSRSLSGVARACRRVGGRRKYVICGVTANWHPPLPRPAIPLPPQVQLSHALCEPRKRDLEVEKRLQTKCAVQLAPTDAANWAFGAKRRNL